MSSDQPISRATVSRRSRFWKPSGSTRKVNSAASRAWTPGIAEAQRRGALGVDDAQPMEVVEPLCSGSAGGLQMESVADFGGLRSLAPPDRNPSRQRAVFQITAEH